MISCHHAKTFRGALGFANKQNRHAYICRGQEPKSILTGGLRPHRPPPTETKVGGRGKIDRNFRENLGFSRKSRIFKRILDLHENLGFSRKSWIFGKILDFRKNLGFLQKFWISTQVSLCGGFPTLRDGLIQVPGIC